MVTATFYIIQENSPQIMRVELLHYAVFLSQHFARQGAKVYINGDSKSEAESLAESFWQVEPEHFISHNLVGEGPKYGTNIEIGYQPISPSRNRQIIINLADCNSTFADRAIEVVDFVPCDENAKILARERYKKYRQAGYQLQTIEAQYPTQTL